MRRCGAASKKAARRQLRKGAPVAEDAPALGTDAQQNAAAELHPADDGRALSIAECLEKTVVAGEEQEGVDAVVAAPIVGQVRGRGDHCRQDLLVCAAAHLAHGIGETGVASHGHEQLAAGRKRLRELLRRERALRQHVRLAPQPHDQAAAHAAELHIPHEDAFLTGADRHRLAPILDVRHFQTVAVQHRQFQTAAGARAAAGDRHPHRRPISDLIPTLQAQPHLANPYPPNPILRKPRQPKPPKTQTPQ